VIHVEGKVEDQGKGQIEGNIEGMGYKTGGYILLHSLDVLVFGLNSRLG
jgi:hypothetical protein